MATGLYLHIPYCRQKCAYCNFYSLGGSSGVPDGYVDALIRELRRFAEQGSGGSQGGSLRPDTVYFGGGTPSLLSAAQAERLLREADPKPGAEITLEANPEGLSAVWLRAIRSAGVNRLSIGIQSADDSILAALGRRHTADEAVRAVCLAREAGFENISGDLMLALPNGGPSLGPSLSLLCGCGLTHISCYLLKIEAKTRFGLHPPAGLPTEDEAAEEYLKAAERLESEGFRQYEISNFARPGSESRHNLIYWNCGDYLGLGPAAYSCLNGRRFHYEADLRAFLAGTETVDDGRVDAFEYIMLQTRLNRGLDLRELRRAWGISPDARQLGLLRKCEAEGLCTLKDDRLCLTKRGMLVQNSILTDVFGSLLP
jgi:putative oxygen-independent coproporphyrinogen III oxidase